MTPLIAATGTLAVGFLVGLLTFRRAGRWCPVCGRTLACAEGHDLTAADR